MPDTLERFLLAGQYRPFRDSLGPDERATYDAVVHGALAYEDSIALPSRPSTEFLKVLEPLDSCAPDQTLRALHDWLVEHAAFADEDESHSHEAPNALLFGIGVCEGVTKALKYLCDVFQLPHLGDDDSRRAPRAVSTLLAEVLTGPIALSYNPHRMVFQAERVTTA